MSKRCPICEGEVSPLQTTKNMPFRHETITVHYRCWFENQEVLAEIEPAPGTDASLAEQVRQRRAEKF